MDQFALYFLDIISPYAYKTTLTQFPVANLHHGLELPPIVQDSALAPPRYGWWVVAIIFKVLLCIRR
jgi:hypothetical protein